MTNDPRWQWKNLTRQILPAPTVGLVIVSAQGRIETLNSRAEAMLNCEAHQVIGSSFKRLFDTEYQDLSGELFLETFKNTALGCLSEITCARQNGEFFSSKIAMSEFAVDDASYYLLEIVDISKSSKPLDSTS